jgi:hypothetical protein
MNPAVEVLLDLAEGLGVLAIVGVFASYGRLWK